jgi:hypothetical protein
MKHIQTFEFINEAQDNLYLQLHKKYAKQIQGLKAKKIKKLTDLVSVQRWSMEDRDDYFDLDPKKKKELSAEYNNERKLFKRYMARDHSVMLPKGTEALAESVNEGHYEDYLDKILEYLESALKASQSTKFNAAKWYSTALSAAIGPAHYKKIARKIGILKDIEDATYTKRDSKKIEAIINTLKKHMNESLNEGKYNIEDLKYQFPLSIEGILGINPAAFKSIKKQGKDLKVIMSSYIDSGNMNDLLHHINMALDYSLRIKEGPKKGQNNIYIIGEGFKYIKTFEAANEVATQVPAKMVAFDDEDDDEETMIKKKKMAGPMGMVGYLGVAEDDEEEESEEERIRKREGRVPGPEGGVGYAGKERG